MSKFHEKSIISENASISTRTHKSMPIFLKKSKSFDNKIRIHCKSIPSKLAPKYFSAILFNIYLKRKEKPKKTNNNNNINIIKKNKEGYGNNYNISILRRFKPKYSSLHFGNYNLNILNIHSNSNNDYGILLKGRIPNAFFSHLLTKVKTSNNEIVEQKGLINENKSKKNAKKAKRHLLAVRNRAKVISIIYYSYSNK